MRFALGCLAAGFTVSACAAPCVAQSGPHTTALVELYTAEGCASCPPAERWLSSLASRGYVPERVVPVALHVDYRDYIGWKDPYAKREFSLRQRKLTQLQRLALVYTPRVMLQGRELRGWGTPAFDEALERINARPAQAQLRIEITSASADRLLVRAAAEVLDSGRIDDAALYLATYEDRLERRASVVLEWQGPLAFSGARLEAERALPLVPGARAANSGVVAFVQNRRTAEILQALAAPSCP